MLLRPGLTWSNPGVAPGTGTTALPVGYARVGMLWTDGNPVVVPPDVPPVGGGGKGKKKKRDITYHVAHEGKDLIFGTLDEVKQFAQKVWQARAKATVKAPVKAAPTPPPKAVVQGPAAMSHQQAQVDAFNAQMAALYAKAVADHQKAIDRAIEEDDAEVFALLRKMDDF